MTTPISSAYTYPSTRHGRRDPEGGIATIRCAGSSRSAWRRWSSGYFAASLSLPSTTDDRPRPVLTSYIRACNAYTSQLMKAYEGIGRGFATFPFLAWSYQYLMHNIMVKLE